MRNRIEVREAVSEVNGRLLIESPKAHEVRSVPIPRFLRDELAVHVAGLAQNELVFSSTRGDLLRVGNWRRRCFDRAAERAGLTGLTPHELRHTAASLAIAAGANVKAVQAMLGHKSAAMTLDRYGHLGDGDLDVLAERLSAARDRAVPQMCPPGSISAITARETAV
jgi:integrase